MSKIVPGTFTIAEMQTHETRIWEQPLRVELSPSQVLARKQEPQSQDYKERNSTTSLRELGNRSLSKDKSRL
jgi:hypothetical protein